LLSTINPAITHGIANVSSVEAGKLADLCLWRPAFFGVKPEIVIKGGLIAYSQMGDANASIPTPRYYASDVWQFGCAIAATSLTFISQAALEQELPARLAQVN